MKRFPGLRRLWRVADADRGDAARQPSDHHRAGALCAGAARSDRAYRRSPSSIGSRTRFHGALEHGENISLQSRPRAGGSSECPEDDAEPAAAASEIGLPWRDDNRFFWQPEHFDRLETFGGAASGEAQMRRRVGADGVHQRDRRGKCRRRRPGNLGARHRAVPL
ncbi:MAG: hypothetical protein MZV49_16110 [Rhodopseudomonas palustris]|nr:hypothetical protein [Rhodopseudomonas palustris]